MKWKLEFQYKHLDADRPDDAVQEEPIESEQGGFIPIPSVGDSVAYQMGNKMVAMKILTRHFTYTNGWCCVNIVVTDISSSEMAGRMKA